MTVRLLLALAVSAVAITAHAQPVADHLKCFKVKDTLPKGTYTANVDGLVAETGCVVKVPVSLLCVDATKTGVTPTPPGGTGPVAHRYLCYKTKCPKGTAPGDLQWHDQFGNRTLAAKVPSKLLCAPELIGCAANGGTCDPPSACQVGAGTCDAQTGQCVYTAAANGTVCRPAAGPCDVQETCDGTNGTCPPDALAAAGTTCPGGVCTGTMASCNVDNPPTFNGTPTVTAVLADSVQSSGQLAVSWSDASDDTSPPSQIFYRLCWSTSPTGCDSGSFTTMQTTAPGTTNATISGLTSDTTYSVWVRAVDGSGNMETGDHEASAQTAVSYASNVNAQIFTAVNTTGGCNGGGACHSPLWTRSNTVNVTAPSCGTFSGFLVSPSDPAHSLIYLKMAGTIPSGCGARMPLGGPFSSTLVQMMLDWINQGAHDN